MRIPITEKTRKLLYAMQRNTAVTPTPTYKELLEQCAQDSRRLKLLLEHADISISTERTPEGCDLRTREDIDAVFRNVDEHACPKCGGGLDYENNCMKGCV